MPPTGFDTDESCLFLNVHTPAPDGARRPVLFWIHGGSYMTGRGASFDGTPFCRNGDLVVVTVNYRLGVLGFLELGHLDPDLAGSGNNGIRDQIAALRWVRDHITAFGGDPNRVTIAGESAGAGSVMALLASPEAEGLFHQAIAQSAPAGFGAPAGGVAESLLEATACESIDDLRALSADALIDGQAILAKAAATTAAVMPGGSGRAMRPAVDGITITRDAVTAAVDRRIPILLGTNGNEGSLFALHLPDDIDDSTLHAMVHRHVDSDERAARVVEAFKTTYPELTNRRVAEEMIADTLFRRSSMRVADAATAAGIPVHVYRFTWKSQGFHGRFGSMHALDLPFVWKMDIHGAASAWERIIGDGAPEPDDLADRMHHAWIAYVTSGDPSHDRIPSWPTYDLEGRPTMIFDESSVVTSDPDGRTRASWDD